MRVADIGGILTRAQLVTLRDVGQIDALAPYIDPLNPKGGAWLTEGFGAMERYLGDIYAAGLRLAFFFSQTTGGSGDPGYFTAANGRRDAGWANDFLAHMRPLGLVPPISDVLYVADIDLDPPSLFDPYANGIDPHSGGAADPALQAPGTYGYQRLIEWARARYTFMGQHLVQTYGRRTGELEAWQDLQETVQGITIDVDDSDVPGWRPGEDDVALTDKQKALLEWLESTQGTLNYIVAGDGSGRVSLGGNPLGGYAHLTERVVDLEGHPALAPTLGHPAQLPTAAPSAPAPQSPDAAARNAALADLR